MKSFYPRLIFFLFLFIGSMIISPVVAQQKEYSESSSHEGVQLFASLSFSPGSSSRRHFIREGFLLGIGMQKPLYISGDGKIQQVFSVTAGVSYGKLSANGALEDLRDQVNPLAFAVPDALNPVYAESIGRVTVIELGAGLQESLYFGKLGIDIGAQFGYQNVARPAFRLEDTQLKSAQTGDFIRYAQAEAVSASGLFLKPAFGLNWQLGQRVLLFTEISYSMGPEFKSNQLEWVANSTDGDPYLNEAEIRAGSITAVRIQDPVNILRVGGGFRYLLK
jgi:hypothetical protein